jgi:serine/threonine protein kinase
LIDAQNTAKIGDFGLATIRTEIKINIKEKLISEHLEDFSLTSDIGTPIYTAPEVGKKNGRYNYKVDLFSLGIW